MERKTLEIVCWSRMSNKNSGRNEMQMIDLDCPEISLNRASRMRTRITIRITVMGFAFVLLSIFAQAASREQALKPRLDRIWSLWKELPPEYQRQKRGALESYLSLFVKTNGAAWNERWPAFANDMGAEFHPLQADVIEAMKISEGYEACYPNPEDRIQQIGDFIFARTPTNALLFVHHDLFETILTLRQREGVRKDVIVLNSSRIADSAYLEAALAYSGAKRSTNLLGSGQRAMQKAIDKKLSGDSEFRELKIVGGKAAVYGIQLMDSLSRLTMAEIASDFPGRAALFLPAVREDATVAAWKTMSNSGMFLAVSAKAVPSMTNTHADWKGLIDLAAPAGKPLHAEMKKAISQSIDAIAGVLVENGQKEIAERLQRSWNERLKNADLIDSREIRINEKGRMILQK